MVLYRKHDGDTSSPWVLGVIDQLVKGRDGLARRALVQRKNPSEETSRVTDRHIRKLVKIWSIEDISIEDDLAELHKRIQNSDKDGRLTGILEERGSHDTRNEFKEKVHVSFGFYCQEREFPLSALSLDMDSGAEEDEFLLEDYGSVEFPTEFSNSCDSEEEQEDMDDYLGHSVTEMMQKMNLLLA